MSNGEYNILLKDFLDWVANEAHPRFPEATFGATDPQMENVAWLRLDTEYCVADIKLWDTGDFYLEIQTIDSDEPSLAELGSLEAKTDFQDSFAAYFGEIEKLAN